MSIVKAEITKVHFGQNLEIDGLMSDEGEFAVAIPQMVELNLIPPNRSTKQLQSLLGMPFESHQWKTPIHPKPVNVISLKTFEELIWVLHEKGVEPAKVFVKALYGVSLYQVFTRAFGKKFEEDDFQRQLETRLSTKVEFRHMTDELKKHGFDNPDEYRKFVWAFQSRLGIASGTRDKIDIKTLVLLDRAQVKLTTLMECGVSPWDALKRI